MVTQRDILNRLQTDAVAVAPEWQPRDTDPVFAGLDAVATQLVLAFGYFNARERAAFVQSATGADLVALARGRGVTVSAEQEAAVVAGNTVATEALRVRTIDALAGIQPVGSLDSIEAFARSAPQADGFVVAQAVAQPNYDTGRVTVFILRTNTGPTALGDPLPGTPTAAMATAVETYITDRRRQPAVDRYSVSATTPITTYTITATINHDGTNATVEADVRNAVYSFIDANRRMGRGIRRGLLSGAVFAVDGVTDVDVTVPATDLSVSVSAPPTDAEIALRERTAYSCRKDATNVVLNFVRD